MWTAGRARWVVGLAGVLVVTLAIGGYLLLRERDTHRPPSAAPTPPPVVVDLSPPPDDWHTRPLELPGGYLLTGATTTGDERGTAVVLDRSTGRYVGFSQYDAVWPAPQGRVAAVFDRAGHRRQTGLLNLATGKVRWIETGPRYADPAWSPEGTRLLLTISPVGETTRIGILDATTGEFRKYPVDESYLCTDHCRFTWMPDGTEVAYQQTDPSLPRSESARHPRRGLQLFSAETGRPTRLLPIRGDVAGPYAWSPDGRHVVIQGPESPELVDATSGEVIRRLPSADLYWAGSDRLVLLEGQRARVVDLTGQTVARQPLPKELRLGYVLSITPR